MTRRKSVVVTKDKPVRYGEKLVGDLLALVAEGHTLQGICATKGMPCYNTICRWRKARPQFVERLADAREQGAEWQAERALQIAAASTKDSVQRDRLEISTRMKHAALSAPGRWGGKAAGQTGDIRIAVRIREFVAFTRPDGRVVTREVFPDGSHHDYER